MIQPNGRYQIKNDILLLLITKHESSCLVDDLRAQIDKKAREISLKPNERTKLILEMKRAVKIKRKEKLIVSIVNTR